MPRVARVPAIPPLPPAIFAPPPWFSPLRPCHPPKRPIWWMNCPFLSSPSTKTALFVDGLPPQALTVRVWALFPGRSVPFQGDLPCQRPISRKVGAFLGGPSMPEALFPGRSVPFQGDLPCQRPISRKVGAFSGGPSMPEAYFPEGPDIILGDQPRWDRLFGRSWGCWPTTHQTPLFASNPNIYYFC